MGTCKPLRPCKHKANQQQRLERGVAAPQVSVLMSVYEGNVAAELAVAVDSVLRQSCADFEFLILCDGVLPEELRNLLLERAARDPRIHLLAQPTRRGVSRSLNTLIRLSTADFVAIMDADDVSAPERLQRQLDFFTQNPTLDIVGCFAVEIDECGVPIVEKRLPTSLPALRRLMSYRDPLIHPSVMYRRKLFDRLGTYSERRAEAAFGDSELWARALLGGCQMANLPDVLYYFRRNQSFCNTLAD